ncbi:hypothetical protein GCM10017688_52280 [Streptomyces ramulosus]
MWGPSGSTAGRAAENGGFGTGIGSDPGTGLRPFSGVALSRSPMRSLNPSRGQSLLRPGILPEIAAPEGAARRRAGCAYRRVGGGMGEK